MYAQADLHLCCSHMAKNRFSHGVALFIKRFLVGGIRVPTNFQTEPHRHKTNKMACAPSEDSDQPGHPHSLIRVLAVRLMGS